PSHDFLSLPAVLPICQRGKVRLQRITFYDLKPSGIMRGDLLQRAYAALVSFDGDYALGTLQKKRARKPSWSGPDLYYGHAVKAARRARDAPRQIEIKQ